MRNKEYMNFNDFIQDGLVGKNEGVLTGISSFDKGFCGILPGSMYVIAAGPGTGKSTLADSNFFLHPYFHSTKKLKFIYFSLELSEIKKKIKWLNYIIATKTGVHIPEEVIAGYGAVKLTIGELQLIDKYLPEVEDIFENIDFYADSINPTGINSILYKYAEANGKFIKEKYKDSTGQIQYRHLGYEPTDPELRTIIIIDHVGLGTPEKGADSEKKIIDKISTYMKWFRNMCNYSPIVIQQFNTGLQSASRDPRAQEYYTPQQLDLGGSSYTFRDAEVVIGGVNPAMFDIKKYFGYQIIDTNKVKGLGRGASFWFIMKNRDFGSFKKVAALYRGVVPKMEELPSPNPNGTAFKWQI